jgi:hypothetical protein
MIRTQQTILKIFSFIHRYSKRNTIQLTEKSGPYEINKVKQIKFDDLRASNTSENQKRERSARKGIERVAKE